ncbi:NUDIX domain-containing protein [Rhizodiscina lignyota]|uniref:NUDIX domain-containing protein n=1 Tax=Rhizodiscina lignyota TaxID=1504668 RepID=A0A9P4IHM2_9PEZI|nr:NUDIX domain-containing protein [Rhizodiscina lignyota]
MLATKVDYLKLVDEVDNVPYNPDFFNDLYKFFLPGDKRPHGFMLPETVGKMPWSSGFKVDHRLKFVQFVDPLDGNSVEDTAQLFAGALQKTIDTAVDQDLFPNLHGMHSEPYKIIGAKQTIHIERFTASLFGIATRGAHMTAYTRAANGELKFWIPRRAPHLFTYPDMLDSTVAGGVKATHSPFQCIVEEADEEASLPADLVREKAKPVGVLTYMTRNRKSGLVRPDMLYVFDLELPEDVVPKPNDEEVANFTLMSLEETVQAMSRGEFKPNCNLVMIDFFVRHGIITEENEVNYVEIISRMHRRIPVPTSPGM